MRKVTLGVVQMQCSGTVEENISKADEMVRRAAGQGALVLLLPELFERWYFCQEKRYESYGYAKPVLENDAVRHFMQTARELQVVLPISFYEKAGNVLYNSVAVIDADGTLLGVYRKIHIPDDHYYQEKFYFTPGNTGFPVWETKYGRIGIGICWDQWFPETARCLALNGAEMILYPTAIGSEPILQCDSMPHWRRCMQGHAACNMVPVAAANRIGLEEVKPDKANGGQHSSLSFYGSSFITDETGALAAEASRDREEVLTASFDLDQMEENRLGWGIFRDRRPECYDDIGSNFVCNKASRLAREICFANSTYAQLTLQKE